MEDTWKLLIYFKCDKKQQIQSQDGYKYDIHISKCLFKIIKIMDHHNLYNHDIPIN